MIPCGCRRSRAGSSARDIALSVPRSIGATGCCRLASRPRCYASQSLAPALRSRLPVIWRQTSPLAKSPNEVAALTAKSLLTVDIDGSGPRFRMLNTTRAYALEKLAESGEVDAVSHHQRGYAAAVRRAA